MVSEPTTVAVRIPDRLLDITGGKRVVTVDPGSVSDVLAAVEGLHPGFAERVLDESGIRRGLAVYVDGVNIRLGSGLATTVRPGELLTILPGAGTTPTPPG